MRLGGGAVSGEITQARRAGLQRTPGRTRRNRL